MYGVNAILRANSNGAGRTHDCEQARPHHQAAGHPAGLEQLSTPGATVLSAALETLIAV
jgi:hypothetical protein